MNLLTGINNSANQKTIVPLEDGTSFEFYLEYRAQQRGWFFDIVYGKFKMLGQRLTCSPNILHQFEGQVSFGLAVLSSDNKEPSTIDAFSLKQTVLILLDSADVASIEQIQFTRE